MRQNYVGSYGEGITVKVEARNVEIPEPDRKGGWIGTDKELPKIAKEYEVLDSRTGEIGIAFKSLQSGGWWVGQSPLQMLVTHWRPIV